MQTEHIFSSDALGISYFGRTAHDVVDGAVFFNWSGSGFEFEFVGVAVAAELLTDKRDGKNIAKPDEAAYIGVFVDDMPFQTARFPLEKERKWYPLAENLPLTKHKIKVVKQTEVGNGRAALVRLKIVGKGELSKPKQKTLHFEFIGDSITCGYGNISSNRNSMFITEEENFSLTYAALTAEGLGANISVVAASGNGIFHDYGCNTRNLIPELYPYCDKMLYEHYGKAPKMWDFSKDKVDLVFIKLGQNDGQFCLGADLPEEKRTKELLSERRHGFYVKLMEFLKELTDLRLQTPVLYIYEREMLLENEICTAINDFNAQYGQKVIPFAITGKCDYESVGANGHWSTYTHARVAYLLIQKVREILCLQ